MLPGERLTVDDVGAWFTHRVPATWFTGPLEVTVDREEILVVGSLPGGDPSATGSAKASGSRNLEVSRFRDETREARIVIAAEAEHIFGRKVSWGVRWGGETFLFSGLAVPVMTRLRIGERAVLDTLIDAGVEHASAVIICTNDDTANLEVALDARRMNPRIRVVMRLFEQQLARKLSEVLNVDAAFSSSNLAAPVVAALALPPWGALALLAVPAAALAGVAAYRGLGHALDEGVLIARSGAFIRHTVVVPLGRAQS
ncbi:MAG: NAD-binding protein, partial [Actinobacteria bacterium]|nr:NAD-binding protein [Actinomycetota bacterium]